MSSEIQKIDTLIKNAKVFNNGDVPVVQDVAIANGPQNPKTPHI